MWVFFFKIDALKNKRSVLLQIICLFSVLKRLIHSWKETFFKNGPFFLDREKERTPTHLFQVAFTSVKKWHFSSKNGVFCWKMSFFCQKFLFFRERNVQKWTEKDRSDFFERFVPFWTDRSFLNGPFLFKEWAVPF